MTLQGNGSCTGAVWVLTAMVWTYVLVAHLWKSGALLIMCMFDGNPSMNRAAHAACVALLYLSHYHMHHYDSMQSHTHI